MGHTGLCSVARVRLQRSHFHREGTDSALVVFFSTFSNGGLGGISVQTSRSLSSSSKKGKSGWSKRSEELREKRAATVESFVKEYMLANQGAFPSAKQVHVEVGGAHYILRDILSELKRRVMAEQASCEQVNRNEELRSGTVKLFSEEFPTETTLVDVQRQFVIEDKPIGGLEQLTSSNSSTEVTHGSELKRRIMAKQAGYEQVNRNEELKNGTVKLVSEEFPRKTALMDVQRPFVTEDKPMGGFDQLTSSISSTEVIHGSGSAHLNSSSHASVEHKFSQISSLKDQISFPESGDNDLSWLAKILGSKNVPRAEGLFSKNSGFRKPLNSNHEGGKRMALLQQIKDFAEEVKNDKHKPERINPSGKSEFRNVELHNGLHKMAILKQNQSNSDGHKFENMDKEPAIDELQLSILSDDDETADTERDNQTTQRKEEHGKPQGTSLLDLILAAEEDGMARVFPSQKLDYSQTGPYESGESGDDSDYAAAEYLHSGPEEGTQKLMRQKSSAADTRNHPNSILVTFLPKTATELDLRAAFQRFGSVLTIQIGRSKKESKFKFAFVHFMTEESAAAAAIQGNNIVANVSVVVNSALPISNKWETSSTLVDDADDIPVPMKYRNQAVAIKGVPHDMGFEHLRHLFSFCGPIANIIMGCSSTIVYIVFETEAAKERALTARMIPLPGSQLDISRVDVPQTTVVRISNINIKTEKGTIFAICKSGGNVRKMVRRSGNIIDVHFEINELINMVKILSSLHGRVIHRHQWDAQPATVIPRELLQNLWSTHAGRHCVHTLFRKLCEMISVSSTDAAKMAELAEQYHRTAKHVSTAV